MEWKTQNEYAKNKNVLKKTKHEKEKEKKNNFIKRKQKIRTAV